MYRFSEAKLLRYSLKKITPAARAAMIEAIETETASGQRLTADAITRIAERHGARPRVVLAACGYQPNLYRRGYVDLLGPPSDPCYIVPADFEWVAAQYLFRAFSLTWATAMRLS